MPMYIKFEDVRLRLVGKVRFTENEDDENRMSIRLANRLIDEAEGQVEQDLTPRYAVPFVSTAAPNTFAALPDRPTKNILRTLCELKAVIRILETDFGAGSSVDGAKYIKTIQDRYKDIINNNVLAKLGPAQEYASSRQWAFPPLPGLKKNYMNTEADDGYVGLGPMVTSDQGHSMDEMENKQSDPSDSFYGGGFGRFRR